jgi:hypothetical protein
VASQAILDWPAGNPEVLHGIVIVSSLCVADESQRPSQPESRAAMACPNGTVIRRRQLVLDCGR